MTPYLAQASEEVLEAFNSGECPKCLGMCNCRGCMRKAGKLDLAPFPRPQMQEYAQHILTTVAPVLQTTLSNEEAVVRPSHPSLSLSLSISLQATLSNSLQANLKVCHTEPSQLRPMVT